MANNNKKITKKSNSYKKVYENDFLLIYYENEIHYFDIDKKIITTDILEVMSYLLINNKKLTNDFYDIEITTDMIENINPLNTIYLLSGGDSYWKKNDISWKDYYSKYEKYFSDKLLNNILYLNNFKEIEILLKKKYNLDVFYDFGLKLKITSEV